MCPWRIADNNENHFNIYAENLNDKGATDVGKIWAYGTDFDRIEYILSRKLDK